MQKEIFLIWAPGVQWRVEGDNLNIQENIFKGFPKKLFPVFYNKTCEGITLTGLIDCFSGFEEKQVINFVNHMRNRKLLLEGIQGIKEIFYHQGKMYELNNSEKMINKIDKKSVDDFHAMQSKRLRDNLNCIKVINLKPEVEPLECLKKRRSIRKFITDKQVTFTAFSQLLSVLGQVERDGESAYYYPSAGGLYPIDCYIYVKKNRVENVDDGLYKYSPLRHQLMLINENAAIDNGVHYFTNKEIFETSAFSIFLVFHADAAMPKYDGMAYYYAILDTGIISQTLSVEAFRQGIGVCSIGDLNYLKVENILRLKLNEKLLHTMEFGLY